MSDRPRYRREAGRACIDVRLRKTQQLFDGRDPAPFHERDLDDDAAEYILDAAREIPAHEPLRIALTFSELDEQLSAADLAASVRAHFEHLRQASRRQLREGRRRGAAFFALGTAVLVALLTLAELTSRLPAGAWRAVLREGLVITGWVALWRPLETLLYDWWPAHAHERLLARVLAADVSVRVGGDVTLVPAAEQR